MSDSKEALELLEALLAAPQATRTATLIERTQGRPGLRDHVTRLLAADATDSPLLDGDGPSLVADLLVRDLSVELPSAARPEDRPIPDHVGPYRIIGELGRGATGVVYEAEQSSPKRRVAVKVIHRRYRTPAARERLLDEARALSDLRHDAIPYVIDAGSWLDSVYIAMELVVGPALDEGLRGAGQRRMVSTFRDLCLGLEQVHRGGWVHRDLKPSNVRLTSNDQPKLLDFGMALSAGERGAVGGTINYASPEQATGAAGDATTDIYAVGVMLYEAIVGRPPIECRGASFVEGARLKRGPVDWDPLDPNLRLVLRRCLQVDPTQRYATAQALAMDLDRWLALKPVRAGRLPPTVHARLLVRRHPRRTRAVLAIAFVTLLAVIGSAVGQRAAHRTREQRAADSLTALQVSTANLREQGRPLEARAALDAWLALPENMGTRAISRAWLAHRALIADVQTDGDRMALAQSLATATDRAGRVDALRALVQAFRREGNWASRLEALHALQDEGVQVDPMQMVRALTATRRIHEAASIVPDEHPIRPMLLAMSRSFVDRPPSPSAPPGPHRPNEPADSLTIRHFVWQGATYRITAESSGDWPGKSVLWRIDADGEVRAVRTDLLGPAYAHAVADLDRDGIEELYIGSAAYTRNLHVLRSPDSPALEAFAPGVNPGADILSALAADIDGDGFDELIVSHADWTSNQVRVYRGGPDGLELVAAVDHDGDLAKLPHPDGGYWLAVARGSENRSDNRRSAGLYLYRLQGGELREQAFHPTPEAMQTRSRHLIVGDFDGDGAIDVALFSTSPTYQLYIARRTGRLAFAGFLVGETRAMAAIDVDGDGDDELWVRRLGHGFIEAMGTGQAQLPPIELPERTPPERWPITQEIAPLFRLGLADEASVTIISAARSAPTTAQQTALWTAAADLAYSNGHADRAGELAEHALALDSAPLALAERAAEWAMQSHDFERAEVLLRRTHATERLRALRARRAHDLRIDWREPWHFGPSGAFRLDNGTLHVDAYGYEGTLVHSDVQATDEHLGFDINVDLDRVEAGSQLTLGFFDRVSLEPELTAVVEAWGGKGEVQWRVMCEGRSGAFGSTYHKAEPVGPNPHSVRVRVGRDAGRAYCSIWLDGEQRVSVGADIADRTSPTELSWSAKLRADPSVPSAALRGRLHGLLLRGVHWPTPNDSAVIDPVDAWVQGDRGADWRTVPVEERNLEVLVEAGQRARVIDWLRTQEPTSLLLAGPLRRDATRWVRLGRQAWGDAFPAMYNNAWGSALPQSPDDPEWLRLDTKEFERAAINDPKTVELADRYSRALLAGGQHDRALRHALRCAESGVEHPSIARCWSTVAAHTDPPDEACDEVRRSAGSRYSRMVAADPALERACGR